MDQTCEGGAKKEVTVNTRLCDDDSANHSPTSDSENGGASSSPAPSLSPIAAPSPSGDGGEHADPSGYLSPATTPPHGPLPVPVQSFPVSRHSMLDEGIVRKGASTEALDDGDSSGTPPSNQDNPQSATEPGNAGAVDASASLPSTSDVYHWNTDFQSLAIILVGLPARGKSFISRRICRWLNWKGVLCSIFNVGEYRRQILGGNHDASFFDPKNDNAVRLRREMAQRAMDDVKEWVSQRGRVGILDATNTTRDRRQWVLRELGPILPSDRILFLESVCDDPSVLAGNIQSKLTNKDYVSVEPTAAAADFVARVKEYEKVYEPLSTEDEGELSFIQTVNLGSALHVNRVHGGLPIKITYFLMYLNPFPGTIYLTRCGETEFEVSNRLGSGPLTSRGRLFGKALAKFFAKEGNQAAQLHVWTSTMDSARHNVNTLARELRRSTGTEVITRYWQCLEEMSYGECEGKSPEEAQRDYPKTLASQRRDPYHVAWPRGENYRHVCVRLEPVILEAEHNSSTLLILAHPDVCRGLYAYLRHLPAEDAATVDFPRNTVFQFSPMNSTQSVTTHDLSSLLDE
eukprot:TRINITY_DN2060_c0_g1_i1.p1 TRINITY_DN2060_c0_g1~~TRINITY_DN2060_c0_g1_i1.p1  ORF type:complete len:581 (-),score=55.78 TRINITY_DN2060_c0_g1_i1:201-1922(-)